MKKEWKIYLVPHTHWDKEWYFIKEASDVFLLDNIKYIKQCNQNNSEEAPFVYDGQFSIIDDYLQYFPEEKSEIQKLMTNKKLIVGPWYTQTDMFNATGESIVRNLLIGTKLAENMGHSMNVVYLPDTFGFNANLPQIATKSGFKGIIQWRGIDDQLINDSILNLWIAKDGTPALTYSLYKHGYFTGVGGLLGQYSADWAKNPETKLWNPEKYANEHAQFYLNFIAKELAFLKTKAYASNNRILIPVGSDQMPMARGWKLVVDAMNSQDNENEWILATYDQFFDDLLADPEVAKRIKPIYREMRYGKYARAHKTINSSRYDIKKLSKQVEYKMYNEVEPLALMYRNYGGEYPASLLLEVTKKLVSSHAHDSLGGCNTDETNRSIINRLEAAYALLDSQATLMKKRIVELIGVKNNQLVLFNLLPYARTINYKVEINTKLPVFQLEKNQQELPYKIINQILFDNNNFALVNQNHLKNAVINSEQCAENGGPLNATNMVTDQANNARYATVVTFAMEMPAHSYQLVDVVELPNSNSKVELIKQNIIENDYYSLTFNNNQINLSLKKQQKTISNAISFEAMWDAGDTYDYSPPKDYQKPINKLLKINSVMYQNNAIPSVNFKFLYEVPSSLFSKEMIHQEITLNLYLFNERIECEVQLDNKAQDIRWRVLMPTGIKDANTSYADQAFEITSRPIHDAKMKIWEAEKWVDAPIEIESLESLVYLKDSYYNYAVFTNGNNEYQIIGGDDTIALTLFRGVSYIGRRGLLYRPGRASGIDAYPHPTPDANLMEPLVFSFAIDCYTPEAMLNRTSKEWCWPSTYYQKQTINPFHWKGDTFVMTQNFLPSNHDVQFVYDLGDVGPCVITAFKESFDRKFDLVRIYNPSDKTITLNSKSIIAEVNLQENERQKTDCTVPASAVRTFVVCHEPRNNG